MLASEAGSDPIQPASVAQVLPPAVALLSPAGAECNTKETNVEVKARAKSSGDHPITGMRLLLDGRPYLGDKGLKKFDPPHKGEVEANWTVELLPGKHSVAVVAESPVSKGVSSSTEVTRLGVKTEELPNLYLVAAGVSAYPGRMALNFAHKDAIVLAKTLQANHQGVFRKVESKLMTDRLATRKNVLDGLAWLEKSMTSKDVAILFLAGHGARDELGQFHFLPVDVDQEDMDKSCVSGSLLKKKLANLPAGSSSCLTPAIRERPATRRSRSRTTLCRNLVSDDVGIVAMCSSQGAEVSMESKEVEHGFFTLGLVEALGGRGTTTRMATSTSTKSTTTPIIASASLSDGGQNPTTGRPQHLRQLSAREGEELTTAGFRLAPLVALSPSTNVLEVSMKSTIAFVAAFACLGQTADDEKLLKSATPRRRNTRQRMPRATLKRWWL